MEVQEDVQELMSIARAKGYGCPRKVNEPHVSLALQLRRLWVGSSRKMMRPVTIASVSHDVNVTSYDKPWSAG